MIVLGFDPGGNNKSAVAFLRAGNYSLSICAENVESSERAIEWFLSKCNSDVPLALGIDTLLHWSLSRSGWRPVDSFLRHAYPRHRPSILPMNSIYGSMLGQGMAVALATRRLWPALNLNEVHPKVLHFELFGAEYPRLSSERAAGERRDCLSKFEKYKVSFDGDLHSEDQFDAILCCLATFLGSQQNGWVDLLDKAESSSWNPSLVFPVPDVNYYWPKIRREQA